LKRNTRKMRRKSLIIITLEDSTSIRKTKYRGQLLLKIINKDKTKEMVIAISCKKLKQMVKRSFFLSSV
jgi:hypothetical protein